MHIVVMTYGPASLGKKAVNRARKLSGNAHEVFAVAASPVAREATANLAGVTRIEETGTAGLRIALEAAGNEPTLLIHDDVVITTRGVMALERELARGSRFAIPYTNDPRMDHFIGSLPTDKAAERMLDQTPVPQESRPVTQIRPSCIAGNGEDLAVLLTETLPDPYAFITSAEHGFVVAGGALASHATECVHRLADPEDEDAPLLVAALIVKNEEELLPECLASLTRICDRIEVCDTGSTDRTVEIAEAAGASVSRIEWNNDFGAARNEVLDRCRDARYALIVDADERAVCKDPLQTRRYLATYWAEHPAFKSEITNLEADGSEMYRFIAVRLFHAAGTEYRGALHEVVHRQGDDAPLSGHRLDQISLHHHGYARELVAERAKGKRNLEIAEAQHESDGDARSAIHLARSLSFAHEEPERALELLESGLAGAATAVTRAQIMGLMADRLLAIGDHRRAFDLSVEALDLLPGDDTALGALSAATERLGNYEEFLAVAEPLRGVSSPRQVVKIEHNRLVFRDQLIAAYATTGQPERAIEEALALLTEAPQALRSWPALIASLHRSYGSAALDLLVPIALLDEAGSFLEPIITTFSSAAVAEFCAAYIARGGTVAEAIRVGLLAAAMSGNEAAFDSLVPAAAALGQDARLGLADRIASSGRTDLAEMLRREPAALSL